MVDGCMFRQVAICSLKPLCMIYKGSFTYYVISRGGGGFEMITLDYGGVANDYVIKIFILIEH